MNSLVSQTNEIVRKAFLENPSRRTPCVLILDRSGSMSEDGKIGRLNQGVQLYADALRADDRARRSVETAIVEFGPVRVRTEFTVADDFVAPHFLADDTTPLGAAVFRAIELVEQRKRDYELNGVSYHRPWLFMITDGIPDSDDPWKEAAEAIRIGEASKNFVFHAVAVSDSGCDMDMLRQLSPKAKMLDSMKFQELFTWLSCSMAAKSASAPGQLLNYAPTTSWEQEIA